MNGVRGELEHVPLGVEQVDALCETVVYRHDDGHAVLDGAGVGGDQFRFILHLEGDVEEVGPAAEFLGHQHLALPADQRLIGDLGYADIVVRIAVPQEARTDVGLLEHLLESRDTLVEVR